jgi:hypothetical protein
VVYRRLPQRCNLEHLRKEAKAVLRVFGRHTRGWRLADAQHAVARGYGFANWSKLKVYVESFAPTPVSDAESPDNTDQDAESQRSNPRHRAIGTDTDVRLEHPIAGTWISNRTKSRWSEGFQRQELMLSLGVAGETITMTQVTLGMPGHELAMKMAIRADGQEHPIEPGSPEVLQARWINSHVLEATVKRGDQTVARGQYELSQDGATLTISTTDHVVVFERA